MKTAVSVTQEAWRTQLPDTPFLRRWIPLPLLWPSAHFLLLFPFLPRQDQSRNRGLLG